jgi:enoyl-CoA hydratase/carnithine racemase
MSGLVLVETLEHGIASVTLNRPDAPLSTTCSSALCRDRAASNDDTQRVVILRAVVRYFQPA